MMTRITIGLAGAVGLLAVLETARYYSGIDPLAFAITLLMGCVFLAGIAELLWVARRTERLRVELDAIPAQATYTHVDGASPLLRSLLSARLDRTALPVPGAVFAPFILSLLVMLGLLGTFLGLFETLRGASHALNASADVDALRDGLKAPISGLMRSFGTSAAGVASSAALGMAAVFVRRDASRFAVALHTVASGNLSHYAPAHRQLVALETLAEQGRAWPTAAAALEQAVQRLGELESSWTKAHADAAKQTQTQLGEAARAIGSSLERGTEATRSQLSEAARSIGASVDRGLNETQKQLADAAERIGSDLQAGLTETRTQLDAAAGRIGASIDRGVGQTQQQLAEATRNLAHSLDASVATTQAELAAAAQRIGSSLDTGLVESRTQLDASAQQIGAAVERGVEQTQRQLAEAAQHIGASFEAGLLETRSLLLQTGSSISDAVALGVGQTTAAATQTQAQLEKASDEIRQAIESGVRHAAESSRNAVTPLLQQAVAEHGGAVREHLGSLREQLETQLEARSEQDARTQREVREQALSLVQALSEQAHDAQAREQARSELLSATLAQVGAQIQTDLTQAASLVRERLERSVKAETEQQQRADALLGRLTEASGVIADAARTQVGALAQFVQATDGRLREAEQQSQQRLSQLLQEWTDANQAQAERMAAFEQSLLGQHSETAAVLGEQLSAHASTLQELLGRSSAALEQASTLIQGSGLELTGVAESFATAVASQREGARQWLESLGDIERYALESGEAAAAAALEQHLARTHEVFDRQLQFQQELIDQLHGLRLRESLVAPRADASA